MRQKCISGLHDLTKPENVYVRKNGKRYCKECLAETRRSQRRQAECVRVANLGKHIKSPIAEKKEKVAARLGEMLSEIVKYPSIEKDDLLKSFPDDSLTRAAMKRILAPDSTVEQVCSKGDTYLTMRKTNENDI